MNRNKSPKRQRLSITILLSVIISVQLLGFFAFPRQVKATGLPVFDAAGFGELIKDGVLEVLTASALGALLNGASYFMRKVAYDTASYIANGGKGQSALVFKKGWGSYLEDVSGNAAATAVDQLGKPFGLDLCKMPSASFQVDLQIGLRSLYDVPSVDGVGGGPEPNCTFQKLKDGWKDWDNMEKLQENALGAFNASLTVSQSDFGIALNAIEQVDRIVAKQRFEKLNERAEGNGFKGVTDAISGNVKTPASVVAEESKALSGPEQTRLTMGQIAGVYGSGARSAVVMAGSVFLNTLVSQGLNNLFTKGLVPDDKGKSAVVDFYAQNILSNKKAVEKAFNYLFTAVPKKQFQNFDILTEMEACPDNPGLNNCIIDSKFREIISRGKSGKSLTIKEAIREGLLDGNKPLISPLRIDDNTNPNCRLAGYCYSNLQKLRKLRIVPIGFELAALRSNPDKPWTLKQVVDGFDNCDPTKKSGQYSVDPKYPFCNMIDPNWILRLPENRCESKVYGPILLSKNAGQRHEECTDISTCITEGPNGECIDDQTYAYCTQEKNVWRINGQQCLPQYNTCKTYTDTKGTIRSYLSRTVDYGSCGAQAVGCAAYSLEKKGNTWVSAPQVTAADKRAGRAQIAFFNKTIANYSCPSDAEGCSAFYAATKQFDGTYKKIDGPEVNLKKAPDFLGCYDVDSAPGVQYPKTSADLAKISTTNSAECKKFAAACLPEETACQSYTPSKGGPAIPGIIGANGCAAACVGYDTFQQEPTQFDAKQYPLYFVPSEGTSCDLQHAGCSEFTNLSAGGAGGETREYFTSVKYCEKPTGTNIKTFYSWEGDSEKGYVLKVHKLRPFADADVAYIQNSMSGSSVVAEFVAGTPAYADDSASELEKYGKSCNEKVYNAYINGEVNQAGFDPDCRAFYDEAGKVSYRLMAKTISVSESCAELRKTEAQFYDSKITDKAVCDQRGGKMENNTCMRCAGGGKYNNDSCVYSALVGDEGTVSCPAIANGCREYTGNAGNNTVPVITSDFEGQNATDGWKVVGAGSISLAAESIQVGLHSLQVNAAGVERTFTNEVTEDGWYELSFWVRGVPQTATVSFGPSKDPQVEFTQNPQTKQSNPVSINNTWRLHRLGPVFLPKGAKKTSIVFSGNNQSVYFLDSVELRKVTEDNLFLIKDSWKKSVVMPDGSMVVADAPMACDANPADTFPGAALGCSAYKDANGKEAYATGFEQLCREEAIGCQALVDTFNTIKGADADKAHVYSAVCVVPVVPPATAPVDVTKVTDCTITVAGKPHTCKIQIGEKSCVVEDFAVSQADLATIPDVNITASTIIVPADTPITEPIFLTNRKEFRCSPEMLGCMKVAKQEQMIPNSNVSSYAFGNELFVKNNPVNYAGPSSILCDSTQVGCSEFNSDNAKSYFKDPFESGNTLCEYHEGVLKDGATHSGWFKSGVGQCKADLNKLCKPDSSESDCGKKDDCINVDAIACYTDYLEPSGKYGAWSNKSEKYAGFVAICPQDANQCTELIDPQSTSDQNPKGKPYFIIFDDVVKDRQKECTGASLDEGCVLFDKTEDPNKKYSSILTYQKSATEENKLVPPQAGTSNYPGDSNIVLKVDRDRECSEWLSCRSSVTQIDENGIAQPLCYDFRACDKQENGICTHWKDPELGNEFLSINSYINRDTSWKGKEFVGYSVPNKYQITYYDYMSVSGTTHLVYKLNDEYFEDPDFAASDATCMKNNKARENWSICGFDKEGRCYNGSCIYPIDKGFSPEAASSTISIIQDQLGKRSQCKAFPEEDSPFPTTISLDDMSKKDLNKGHASFLTKKPGYQNANVCQDGDCSCRYTRVEYKGNSAIDFWTKKNTPQEGLCVGGPNDGIFCNPASLSVEACGEEGVCEAKASQQTHIGLTGLCIEEDLSRPLYGSLATGKAEYACLTWLPVEVNVNGLDNYNNFPDAGYNPGTDAKEKNGVYGQTYCMNAATGASGPVADDKLLIPHQDYKNIYDSLASAQLGLPNMNPILYGGYLSPSWPGSDLCKDYQSENFSLEFGKFETSCTNLVERCLIHPGTGCGNNKNLKSHTFAQWVYSTARNTMASSDKQNKRASAVWFVDNIGHWKNYFGKLADHMDGNKDNGELFADCKAGGNATCHQAYKHYYYIGKQLSGAENAASEPYILPSVSTAAREDMIDTVYFSPFMSWLDFSNGWKDHSPVMPYYGYNKLYINFKEIQNELVAKKLSKQKGVILNKYQMTTAFGDSSYFNVYQAMKQMDNKNTRYLALVVQSTGITEDKVIPVINKFLKADKPVASVSADGFSYTVVYIDFKPDGTLILDTLPNDNKPRPFFIKTAFNDAFSDYFFKDIMLDRQIVASTVVFKPYCTDFRQVYDDSVANTESVDKAWTNRVWEGAMSKGGAKISSGIPKSTAFSPYGSINKIGSELKNSTVAELFGYVFESITIDGIPQKCDAPLVVGMKQEFTYQSGSEVFCGELANVVGNDGVGYDEKLRQGIHVNYSNPSSNTDPDGVATLFAKAFLNKKRDDKNSFVATSVDHSKDIPGYAPTIFSLNPALCRTKDGCVPAEENAFTVNEKNATQVDYDGDGLWDEDPTKEGQHEAIIEKGTKAVVVRFFAAVDDNRMPIRRIMLNWGDNTTVTNKETFGRYKNRKPYCGAPPAIGLCGKPGVGTVTSELPSLATCKVDADCKFLSSDYKCLTADNADKTKQLPKIIQGKERYDAFDQVRFGNDTRACQEGYYEYTHSYTCPKSKRILIKDSPLSEATKAELKSRGLKNDTDEVCVYKPGVQIMDNWGWCNGEEADATSNPTGKPKSYYGPQLCNLDKEKMFYTNYKGYIVIIPEKK